MMCIQEAFLYFGIICLVAIGIPVFLSIYLAHKEKIADQNISAAYVFGLFLFSFPIIAAGGFYLLAMFCA